MRRYILKTKQSMLCSALLLAATLASFSFAQTKPAPQAAAAQTRQPYLISTVHVQLGMVREWQDLVKNEWLPAQKKGGVNQIGVWTTATLGEAGEFMIVRPIRDGAELDEPSPVVKALGQDAAAALMTKLQRLTASSRTYMITTRPDLSVAPASGYVQKLAGLTATSVAPGRTEEYEKAQKELLAVISRTNVKGHLVSRVSGGGNPDQYFTLMLFDSFADMNQLGPAFRKAATEANLAPQPVGLVVHTERTAIRYVPELSIQPPAQKAAK